jgi:hypothetical protein
MLKSIAKKLPPIAALLAERDALVKAQGFVPAGHFYSPIVSIQELKKDERRIFRDIPRTLADIDLNESQQLDNLAIFEEIYHSINFPA